jgi:hypothetical protein
MNRNTALHYVYLAGVGARPYLQSMTFTRIRTINGRRYLYEERRWREDGKVKSKSILLSVLGGILDALVSIAPSGNDCAVDRTIVGHATEVEDMQQGAEQLAGRETEAPQTASTFDQDSFLAQTAAEASAAGNSSAGPNGADASDKGEGEAEADGGE